MTRMQPGQETGSRRRAHRAPGIELRKPHPFRCHLVKLWSLEMPLPHAAQILVPQVVRDDPDNVRLAVGLFPWPAVRRAICH